MFINSSAVLKTHKPSYVSSKWISGLCFRAPYCEIENTFTIKFTRPGNPSGPICKTFKVTYNDSWTVLETHLSEKPRGNIDLEVLDEDVIIDIKYEVGELDIYMNLATIVIALPAPATISFNILDLQDYILKRENKLYLNQDDLVVIEEILEDYAKVKLIGKWDLVLPVVKRLLNQYRNWTHSETDI